MSIYTIAHYKLMSGLSVLTHSYVIADSLAHARQKARERGIYPLTVGRLNDG